MQREWYTPGEAVHFLNERLNPTQPINTTRLSRLRRMGRVKGEKLGEEKGRFTMYSRSELEQVSLQDIQDLRKTGAKTS